MSGLFTGKHINQKGLVRHWQGSGGLQMVIINSSLRLYHPPSLHFPDEIPATKSGEQAADLYMLVFESRPCLTTYR